MYNTISKIQCHEKEEKHNLYPVPVRLFPITIAINISGHFPTSQFDQVIIIKKGGKET
jgi:hypothetical protein